jgi:CMP-N-acetylneuraminic acid synthetase
MGTQKEVKATKSSTFQFQHLKTCYTENKQTFLNNTVLLHSEQHRYKIKKIWLTLELQGEG